MSARRGAGLGRRIALFGLLLAGLQLPAPAASAAENATLTGAVTVAHRLSVELDPEGRRLSVDDRMLLLSGGAVEFLLNSKLEISRSEPAAEPVPLGDVAPFFSLDASHADAAAVSGSTAGLRRYRVQMPEGGGSLHLTYAGPFDFGLGKQEEEYQRGFRETAGIVSPEGVYLAGNGFWYPQFDRGLIEFALTARVPEGWHLVSQGNGVSRDSDGKARWDSAGPMEEIYLVGGPLVLYRQTVRAAGADGAAGSMAAADAGGVGCARGAMGATGATPETPEIDAEVYLRQADPELAGRYLAATAQYLEMYRRLIGPYPYGKFALVENFWETGYGMPSFTLLGSQVIRMPFIVTSSYPHEILHNWWGNSVLVDSESGNWCEGLTAYMADHLLQEQRGQGEAYRRDTLQKYASYVRGLSDGRDFPLREFRARHSAATEAVGYGKALMGFHMLRRKLGDDAFRAWAARFYREKRGKQASFADIRRTMEAVAGAGKGTGTGTDLGRFFHDWTERPGAAALAVESGAVIAVETGFEVRGTLRQTQAGEPFSLDVPVAIQTATSPVVATIHLESAATPFAIRVPARPLALQVDPSFDLFRRLDPREMPPSIGQIFGEPRALAVIAADASPEETAAWRKLIESWRTDSHAIEIATDAEVAGVAALPADRAIWLLGRGNRLAARSLAGVAGLALDAEGVGLDGQRVAFAGHSTVVVVRHPGSAEHALGWLAIDPALAVTALPGLGRKLPHYGKYSYLAFEGSEPTNVVKGQWATVDSPLRLDLRPAAERSTPLPPLALEPRRALAELPAGSAPHP